ncbi:MAG: S41 family peptidase [Candidatus Omnitrophota bacterium]|nr:S41 family peptidase [Candidatus Omnitrophota bacterium]
MKFIRTIIALPVLATLILCNAAVLPAEAAGKNAPAVPDHYKPYLDLLASVYEKMETFYYKPVSKAAYEEYVQKYKASILAKLTETDHKIDIIAHRGAGLLVNRLKDPKDKFTNFIPPKEAREYSKKIYGYEYGIGVEGRLTKDGYFIEHVQIRSDAYAKGIRDNGIILKIDGVDIGKLDETRIKELIYPPLNTVVTLDIAPAGTKKISTYEILCEEYFNETITAIPTGTSGIYCLKISAFNRMTGEDLKGYIKDIAGKKTKLLILDLTDNPGGPPLAVYELSGIFLPPKQKLFYYRKKNVQDFGLVSPSSDIHYDGPVVILINKGSGSAAEIMAAVFKEYGRGLVMGKEPSAGMAFLKSSFIFDDGSMLAMITGNTYLFNGAELDTTGVQPDEMIPPDVNDIIGYVADKFVRKGIFNNNRPKGRGLPK